MVLAYCYQGCGFQASGVYMGIEKQLWGSVKGALWVVVKIVVPFLVPIIIRHLLFRAPKKGP